jgi:hypothetical protein
MKDPQKQFNLTMDEMFKPAAVSAREERCKKLTADQCPGETPCKKVTARFRKQDCTY